ncbi:MAG: serine--tRNA ligase [Candidatus Moranbacteria bacterium]|nr:serine--tRNA ligase [Candidatus Moranbacteria bacterium]
MLDISFIRANVDAVKEAVVAKNLTLDVDALLAKDGERITLLQELEELKSLKNDINDLIKESKTDEERAEIIAKGKEIKVKIDELEPRYTALKKEFDELMLAVPNIPSADTPRGKDESENVVLRKVGVLREFSFQPKEHWELGEALGVIDTERATKVSGTRFTYLKGDLALLQFALVQYVFSVLSDETKLKEIIANAKLDVPSTPFVPVVPPVFIKPEPFERMARINPKDERYYLPEDDLYLIGSAEHTLGSMYMDETLDEAVLPLRYIGYSTSFRREAGASGKDMKGILRLHQFDKLEMEAFTIGEKSIDEQNFFVAIQEYLVTALGIPYQVVQICTGDMGVPDARQIDIECFMPGQNKYRETHTSDLMTDYQARRLNTRVKRSSGTTEFVHMNDGTAFAIGRALIAILENYQQADGSVTVPEVLRPFVGKDVIKPKNIQ